MNDPLTRRAFVASGSATLAAALAATQAKAQTPASPNPQTTPGAPTTFGSSPAVGPAVSPETFSEAEKLVQVELTPAERAAVLQFIQALAKAESMKPYSKELGELEHMIEKCRAGRSPEWR